MDSEKFLLEVAEKFAKDTGRSQQERPKKPKLAPKDAKKSEAPLRGKALAEEMSLRFRRMLVEVESASSQADTQHRDTLRGLRGHLEKMGLDGKISPEALDRHIDDMTHTLTSIVLPADAYAPEIDDAKRKLQLRRRAEKGEAGWRKFIEQWTALQEALVGAVGEAATTDANAFIRAQATRWDDGGEADVQRMMFDMTGARTRYEHEQDDATDWTHMFEGVVAAGAGERGPRVTGAGACEPGIRARLLPTNEVELNRTIWKWWHAKVVRDNAPAPEFNAADPETSTVTPDMSATYKEWAELQIAEERERCHAELEASAKRGAKGSASGTPTDKLAFEKSSAKAKLQEDARVHAEATKDAKYTPPAPAPELVATDEQVDALVEAALEYVFRSSIGNTARALGMENAQGEARDEAAPPEESELEEEIETEMDILTSWMEHKLTFAAEDDPDPDTVEGMKGIIEQTAKSLTRADRAGSISVLSRMLQQNSGTLDGLGLHPLGRYLQRLTRWLKRLPFISRVGSISGMRFGRSLKIMTAAMVLMISLGFGAAIWPEVVLDPWQWVASKSVQMVEPLTNALAPMLTRFFGAANVASGVFFASKEAGAVEDLGISPAVLRMNGGVLGTPYSLERLQKLFGYNYGQAAGRVLEGISLAERVKSASALAKFISNRSVAMLNNQGITDEETSGHLSGALDFRNFGFSIYSSLKALKLLDSTEREGVVQKGKFNRFVEWASGASDESIEPEAMRAILAGYAEMADRLVQVPDAQLDNLGAAVGSAADALLVHELALGKNIDQTREMMEAVAAQAHGEVPRWTALATTLPLAGTMSTLMLNWLSYATDPTKAAELMSDDNLTEMLENGWLGISTTRFLSWMSYGGRAGLAKFGIPSSLMPMRMDEEGTDVMRGVRGILHGTALTSLPTRVVEVALGIEDGDVPEGLPEMLTGKREGEQEILAIKERLKAEDKAGLPASSEERALTPFEQGLEVQSRRFQRDTEAGTMSTALVPASRALVPYDPPQGSATIGVGAWRVGRWVVSSALETIPFAKIVVGGAAFTLKQALIYFAMSRGAAAVARAIRESPGIAAAGGLAYLVASNGLARVQIEIPQPRPGASIVERSAVAASAFTGRLLMTVVNGARATTSYFLGSMLWPYLDIVLGLVKGHERILVQQEAGMIKIQKAGGANASSLIETLAPLFRKILPDMVRGVLVSGSIGSLSNMIVGAFAGAGVSAAMRVAATAGYVLSFTSWAKTLGNGVQTLMRQMLKIALRLKLYSARGVEVDDAFIDRAADKIVAKFTGYFRNFMVWTNEFGSILGVMHPIASALRTAMSLMLVASIPYHSISSTVFWCGMDGITTAVERVRSTFGSWSSLWSVVTASTSASAVFVYDVAVGMTEEDAVYRVGEVLFRGIADFVKFLLEGTSAGGIYKTAMATGSFIGQFTVPQIAMAVGVVGISSALFSWLLRSIMGTSPMRTIGRTLAHPGVQVGAAIAIPAVMYIVGAPLFHQSMRNVPIFKPQTSEGFQFGEVLNVEGRNLDPAAVFGTMTSRIFDARDPSAVVFPVSKMRLAVQRSLLHLAPTVDLSSMDTEGALGSPLVQSQGLWSSVMGINHNQMSLKENQ